MRMGSVGARAAAIDVRASMIKETVYVRRRPWTSDTFPKGRRKAAVVIRNKVTTQLMRSGVVPN
mgnify:CR=1 FL=1